MLQSKQMRVFLRYHKILFLWGFLIIRIVFVIMRGEAISPKDGNDVGSKPR